ncbi:ATP-binding protein [Bradyrhizobium sp. SZCCHNS3002]|uniref:ATP-binding protein n=1 Tax=Bradyrhizobium sp. SZCCHNS3002 TaxID=3057310 RepID=UPI0028ECD5D0|nr:ATP-binding protein [Bradyrhizobium sp. SZCCHNS3002]
MMELAAWLANEVRRRVAGTTRGSSEVRLIFHGPPLEVLAAVYDDLAKDGESIPVPILLQVPSLAPGQANPPIGASGRCEEGHLLDLRNSPSNPSFLALVPPGVRAIMSVTSTTDEFGLAATSDGSDVSFGNWWAEPLVQDAVGAALDALQLNDQQRAEASALVERAAAAADAVDAEQGMRANVWRLLARIFSVSATGLGVAEGLSLACGVPPMDAGTLSAAEQQASLDGVVAALSDGFRSGLEGPMQLATRDQRVWLEAFLGHIRNVCDVPTALERGGEPFYQPNNDWLLGAPPQWWTGLTVEVWASLLSDEPEIAGDIQIEVKNAILPPARGVPLVVESTIELAIRTAVGRDGPVTVRIERSPGKTSDGFPLELEFVSEAEHVDATPPRHRSPIQYKGVADGHRPASTKVISLASWAPGIVVACRLARKVVPPKAPSRRARDVALETSIALPGPGRYELLLLLADGVELAPQAIGTGGEGTASAEAVALSVRELQAGRHQLEVDVDGAFQVDLQLSRTDGGKAKPETCRVYLSVDDVAEDGCGSEFERLIKLNRRLVETTGAKPVVQVSRSRASTLQGWMLQSVALSYLPLVLADDYGDHWSEPAWAEECGRILSGARYLRDPRPPASAFSPPAAFLRSRAALAEMIRGEEHSNLTEAAPLGEWLKSRDGFGPAIETYVDSYASWLKASPETARWADVTCIASLEPGGRTISRVPDAILLSPLHPLRLAWHAVAQGLLVSTAASNRPCPAAGVLDPGVVPDILHLPLTSPEGLDEVPFLAVEANSDYWSVLWNGNKLSNLPARAGKEPFGAALGLSIGGISAGFSSSQVVRALDDVANVLCAKPRLTVHVASAGGATEACNEGLIAWSSQRFGEPERFDRRHWLGARRLDVFDGRRAGEMPEDSAIANLSEDTGNRVRWLVGAQPDCTLDLGIIAQLESSEPEASPTTLRSALGLGGLIRHRVRKQLPSAFLSESRQSLAAPECGEVLADKVAALLSALENTGPTLLGLRFAPDVHAIGEMLEQKKADYVAVSSSAVDPACFLGDWLPNSYLWDYDLPSYSHRAGDTNGYYLLSRIKSEDRDGLKKVLSRLPGGSALNDDQVAAILLEVARRGIPTIRGLAGDDTGAAGDLGLFVAARLLQDRFRGEASAESLLPVVGGTIVDPRIALVVPVDPFRRFVDDLARALHKERPDATLARPDLMVICATFKAGSARIHLTPVEVKCRLGAVFPQGEVEDALGQAKSLSGLLSTLAADDGELSIWRLAYQQLLLSIAGFGMRVYSQHHDLSGGAGVWSAFHEQIASAILTDPHAVSIDPRGRLVIVDDSPVSNAFDKDKDGFDEVIVVSGKDAGRVVAGDAQPFYDGVKAKVGDWGLMPPDREPAPAMPVGSQGSAGNANDGVLAGGEADEPFLRPSSGGGDVQVIPANESTIEPQPASETDAGVAIEVGRTIDGFQPREVTLALSDTRLNQLNMGVVGDLGTGKTQLLKSLIHQIGSAAPVNRGIRPRVLIFDYKRDYSSDDFVEATGARVVRPRRLPLNLFDTRDIGDSGVPWLDRFRFFADVLDKIYSNIGPVQRDKLKKAVRQAYASGQSPTIYDVHAAYGELLDGKSDSPMSIIDDLVDMEIFESDPAKCLTFGEFLNGTVVISLDALGQDDRSKNMLVAIMLNMFYENMLRTPKRPFIGTEPQLRAIDSFLLVDEADNIMRYEFDVLRKLLLQGREFGCGVILASQYLRHFKAGATDYREPLLTWFVHKVPSVTAAELAALGLGPLAAELADRIKMLRNHQCLYKSFDVQGEIVRGLPFFELRAREAGD